MCAVQKPSDVPGPVQKEKNTPSTVETMDPSSLHLSKQCTPLQTVPPFCADPNSPAFFNLVLSKYRGNSDSLAQAQAAVLSLLSHILPVYHTTPPLQPSLKARTAPSSAHLALGLGSGEYTASALDHRM
jgi:hypothetical protein